MLKENFWKKIFGLVLVEMMFLGGILSAQPKEKPEKESGEIKKSTTKQEKRIKSSCALIVEAYKKGEIDFDTAFLYKCYIWYGIFMRECLDYLPEEYKAELTMPEGYGTSMGKEVQEEFIENWNKFRPETKKKLRELNLKWITKLRATTRPTVKITYPKENEVVYSPEIVVKGIIETPEVYELTTAWMEVGENGLQGEKKEIKMPAQPEYIPGEETFEDNPKGKLEKERYLKRKEEFKDKPSLTEALGPPGKKVCRFSEKIILPSTGIWFIGLGAKNEGSEFTGQKDYDSVTVIYPPKEKKDNEPPEIKIRKTKIELVQGTEKGIGVPKISGTSEIKDKEVTEQKEIFLYFTIADESKVVSILYLNEKKWSGIGTETGISIPLSIGTNIIKVVAVDEYGNISHREVEINKVK